MKGLNRLLMVATIAVLLLPAAVVGTALEACCGVYPGNLVVSDTPDPVCLETGTEEMISGTYTVFTNWGSWTQPYDTGVIVRIWDPDGNQVVDQNMDLAIGESTAPKDFAFNYPFLPGMAGAFTYEVLAWSNSPYGRMELTALAQTFTAEICNQSPDCSLAAADPAVLWPPDHEWTPVNVVGVTDPDGDALTLLITSIWQDEPVDSFGDGRFTPDGQGVGAATAEVRRERAGTNKVPGDGRCYTIGFTANDGLAECAGTVVTCVPHDMDHPAVDGGALFDSTLLAP